MIAPYLLVEQGKGCTIQSLSADQRSQRQSKNPHNKEKKKNSGKKSCVSSSFLLLVILFHLSTAFSQFLDSNGTELDLHFIFFAILRASGLERFKIS